MADLATWLRDRFEAEERLARGALAEIAPRVEPAGGAGRAHAAAWSPERVMLELALKRRIVTLHRAGMGGGCACCPGESWPCLTVRLLAIPYADQAGYQPSWRP